MDVVSNVSIAEGLLMLGQTTQQIGLNECRDTLELAGVNHCCASEIARVGLDGTKAVL